MGVKHRKRTTLPKYVEHAVKGRCKICRRFVKNLKAHIKVKHKGQKSV